MCADAYHSEKGGMVLSCSKDAVLMSKDAEVLLGYEERKAP